MAHLGSFGAAVKEATPASERELDDFEFCGEKFLVPGTIPAILMLQMGAAASGKVSESEGFAAMWEAYRTALGDKDFTKFYKTAVANSASTDDLMGLVFALFEAQDGRPTEEASASSPGPSTTSPSSSTSSTPAALAHLTPVSQVLAG